MIEVKITEEMRARAKAKADEMGRLNNSITKGEGNYAGFLGEEIVKAAYPKVVTIENTYDYDLKIGRFTADVKTKRCTTPPKSWYEASVAKYNTRQRADLYVFTRIYKDYEVGWIMGFMFRSEFYEKAKELNKGDLDPSNNYVVKASCYNMKYEDMRPFGPECYNGKEKEKQG